MGEICEQTRRVLAWLGRENESISSTFEFLTRIALGPNASGMRGWLLDRWVWTDFGYAESDWQKR
jgi:hypothetical protein